MYWKVSDELSIEGGKVVRGDKLIPPDCLHQKIISEAHVGHLESTNTKRKIKNDFWWPKMDSHIDILYKDV